MLFDSQSASCEVFTFKEGTFSPFAHDLKIRVGKFSIRLDPEKKFVSARFGAASLFVENAMRNGVEQEGILSEKDRQTIDRFISEDVLDSGVYEEIRFDSVSIAEREKDYLVTGVLYLHGEEREIAFKASRGREFYIAEISLHQPSFGIRPFSAMMGAIRVKPEVTVRITLPVRGSNSP